MAGTNEPVAVLGIGRWAMGWRPVRSVLAS
jgi:hypothetical protein